MNGDYWDDMNATGYAQVVEELVGGAVARQYTYGLQRISQQQLISNTWTPSFYGYDGSGNVRQLTNAAGTVTDTYEYDAFGNSFTKQGTTPNVYLYRGEQYDPDLGLYYLRARYYNPATGRFMSRDPEDGNTIDPSSLHKYLYGGGDPINRIDPRGRADTIQTVFTITVISTPTEVALSAVVGQATAAFALIQAAAGQAFLTTQYLLETIAAIAHASGLEKFLACSAGGLLVSDFLDEKHITGFDKKLVLADWGLICGGWYPAPGFPSGPNQN
jgi:RHS repeat-associated protein